MKSLTKDERRAMMPESTKFIDDMRESFGELVGIEALENGQSVQWGESWGDCEAFPVEGSQ